MGRAVIVVVGVAARRTAAVGVEAHHNGVVLTGGVTVRRATVQGVQGAGVKIIASRGARGLRITRLAGIDIAVPANGPRGAVRIRQVVQVVPVVVETIAVVGPLLRGAHVVVAGEVDVGVRRDAKVRRLDRLVQGRGIRAVAPSAHTHPVVIMVRPQPHATNARRAAVVPPMTTRTAIPDARRPVRGADERIPTVARGVAQIAVGVHVARPTMDRVQ